MTDKIDVRIASNAVPSMIFDDPNFVRAHVIIVSARDGSVHAVLHETDVHVGMIDHKFVRELYAHEHVALSARRPDGSIVTIHSPLKIAHA